MVHIQKAQRAGLKPCGLCYQKITKGETVLRVSLGSTWWRRVENVCQRCLAGAAASSEIEPRPADIIETSLCAWCGRLFPTLSGVRLSEDELFCSEEHRLYYCDQLREAERNIELNENQDTRGY